LKESVRDLVKERMEEQGTACQCIRCREYGHRVQDGWQIGEPRMTRMDYDASGGREVFLSVEDERETLFGLLRMRVQDKPIPVMGGEVNGNLAVIRELHVYGPEVPLRQQKEEAAQHRGLGKALLGEAERIAAEEFGVKRMAILSGVGAREYYRAEFGYVSQDDYMVKGL